MNISEYRRGDNVQLSKHFNTCEFECRCGKCQEVFIFDIHIDKLQELRDKIDMPIAITSGYRCPEHNAAVGGAKKSQHMLGTATDIIVRDLSPIDVYNICDKMFDGVGKYDSFTHVDSRGYKARW